MRALVYINPSSRKGSAQKAKAIQCLRNLGIEVVDVSRSRAGQLRSTLRKSDKVECFIVGGGDGTINGVLKSLMEFALPVGLLPLGTANDLAATLNIPSNIESACRVIATGKTRTIDIGCVNNHYFVNEGSLGISTPLIRSLDPAAKKRLGIGAAFSKMPSALSRIRPFRARIRWDNCVAEVSTLQITVGNGERFGGLIKPAPADIGDHRLDLYSLEAEGFAEIAQALPALWRNEYTNVPGIRFARAREVEIHTSRPKSIYTDGELATATPAIFRLLPSALTVYAGPSKNGG